MQIYKAVSLDQFCLINIDCKQYLGMVCAGSVSIKKGCCYSATVCLNWFFWLSSGLLCTLPSHLLKLYVTLTLLPSSPFTPLDWLTLCYVFHKSIDPVSF